VRLTNKFVAKLTGEEMWWDDDPRATGFGVRSYVDNNPSIPLRSRQREGWLRCL
jgi:hypothetical protein